MRAPCKIDGCERTSAGRGWCKAHWARWRKHGDPTVVKKPGVDFNVRSGCRANNCKRHAHSQGWCSMHLARVQRHGNPDIVLPIIGRPLLGEHPSYAAVHKRLERSGRASERACVDCGGKASSWSYIGGCPEELTQEVKGRVLAYSTDPARYQPRCTSCHRTFDRAGDRPRNEKGRFVPGAEIIVRQILDDAQAAAA